FVQIEDWSGRIEASFFRDAFVEFGPLLTRDALLVIEGGLSFDDFSNAHQLRARSVLTLEQACERFARSIRVALNGVGPAFVDSLRSALAAYRGGQTPLRLSYASAAGKADLDLGPEWRVRAGPDLMRALHGLPGVKSAELLLTRANSAN
ncbi:MAG TPA: DNA polymerase III subunit alpha, partial [Rhodanobacteraceae bacterium]|nr:DNA polymerase III subunit alpha [Rhodanobacteraceae bacterium]